jgi:hypothetical protein
VTGRFSCACAASVTPRGQGGLASAVWDRNPPFRTHGRRTLLPSARLACVSCLSCVRKYTHRQPAGQSAPGPARARRKCLTPARNLQAYASERGPNEQNRFKARAVQVQLTFCQCIFHSEKWQQQEGEGHLHQSDPKHSNPAQAGSLGPDRRSVDQQDEEPLHTEEGTCTPSPFPC